MKRAFVGICAALLLGFGIVFPSSVSALTETEVAEGLLCYACPGEPLNVDRCGGGDQMRAAIKRLISEGKPKEEILQYFAAQYGEGILTAPPKRGFNLVAYLGPFVGLLVGALVATLVVRRWSTAGRRGATAGQEAPASQAPLDEATRRRIEEELSNLDKEG
ncbi:MAG: cytochrome c-type biogenesis protein [Candidatus Geothermincolia bacterium]